MVRQDIVNAIALKMETSHSEAAKMLDAVVETIQDGVVSGEKVKLFGFGTFEVKNRAERKGHNPSTGDELMLPARKALIFHPGKVVKRKINQKN